jgi:hypothetical protein
MFLITFLPFFVGLLHRYSVAMTSLRLACPRQMWKLLRVADILIAHVTAWGLAAGIVAFTRKLTPTLRADDSGKLPDARDVWEKYLARKTFVPSESVTGMQGPFGAFIAHLLYHRPARIEQFDVATDLGLRQRLSLRRLYHGNMAHMRDDGSMEPDISRYEGSRFNTGFSVCVKMLVDTHNAFVRELRAGWDPFLSLQTPTANACDMIFAKAAALNWHTCVNFVENEYFRGYTGFAAPFIFKYLHTARVRVLGFSRIQSYLSTKLCVGVLAHLAYRPHWVLRNEISPFLPYAIGGVGELSCHQAVAHLTEDRIASLFRHLASDQGGAAVPRNIPEFLERALLDALMTGRTLRVSYNDVLRSLRLPEATSFDRFRDGSILQGLYESVDDVEFPIGLIGDRLLTDRDGGAEASYVMDALLVLSIFFDELFGRPGAGTGQPLHSACLYEKILDHPEAKWEALFACLTYRSVGDWMDWIYGGGTFARPDATRSLSPGERERLGSGYQRFDKNMGDLISRLSRNSAT